jgi:hypothetical protein
MIDQNSTIELFQLIRSKTDDQTATDAVSYLQDTIKEEVKTESTIKFNDGVHLQIYGTDR